MQQRAIVVGASSGIGAALVEGLVRRGARVTAVARRGELLVEVCARANAEQHEARATAYVHDVTDVEGTAAAFQAIVQELDGLDILIYCAGIMPEIGPDQYDPLLDQQIVQVNLIGAMAWLNLAAERFRLQGSGSLVGVGSVAGDRGRIGNPAYCASKAGLHTFMESLRNRLDRHGVKVVTVKPGPVDTPMTAGRDKLPLLIDAERCARDILSSLEASGTVYVPGTWRPIMAAIQTIPSVFFRRMDV
ncbi:MAG: SDR family NAD(P)-dependent oxidoreductase [Deltaproteobacteria bacterium]|nr:MAG: SDR family NAD(P)-dependent oxidoreductase [Deltaproteobacteria bacterium]